MAVVESDLTSARARIAAAYRADALEAAGSELIATLADHFRAVYAGDTKALNWNPPAKLVAEARQFLDRGERRFTAAVDPANHRRPRHRAGPRIARPRPKHAPSPLRRPSGAGPRAARRAVRFARQRHEPGDGDLRDGSLGDRRGARNRRGGRRAAWFSARQFCWTRDLGRITSQPHRPAHSSQCRARRCLVGRHVWPQAGTGARRARRCPLLRLPLGRHPRPRHRIKS